MHLNYYPFSEVMIAVIFPSDLIRNVTETVLHISHRFPVCSLIGFSAQCTQTLYVCEYVVRVLPSNRDKHHRTSEREREANNGYLRLINTIKINLYSSQIQLAAK